MAEETKRSKTTEKRRTIDVIDFAILSFLSDQPYSSQELKRLLIQYTHIEISKTPFARRMRILAEEKYVKARSRGHGYESIFSLTKTGKKFCLDWAHSLRVLCELAAYTLEMKKGDVFNETK